MRDCATLPLFNHSLAQRLISSVLEAPALRYAAVDTPVKVAGVTVHHPLLVVEGLAFSLLIGTDILRAHGAILTLDETVPVRLRNRECSTCREQRTDSPDALPLSPLTACAACSVAIEPCTAAFIRVRASTALCKLSNVAVEPLASLLDKNGCAAFPSVHTPSSSEVFVSIANHSNSRVEIPANTPRRCNRARRTRRQLHLYCRDEFAVVTQ